ncbi:hypothetical protein GCM10025770_31000 [Viridibacterium curvum]|uniref:Uncharacterized protein n=1 Tax=Viridibacterium curvum TaxID=1101404 RepID=A0ABP9QYG8_9RHOO
MAEGNLATVGEAGFEGGAFTPLDNGNLMARFAQVPGGCDSGDSGSYDDNMHRDA